jgi:hypothetical protein
MNGPIVDPERTRLAVELQAIAAKVFRDVSALARAVARLHDPALAPARIGGVLHRYAVEHKQAYADQVAPIAEAIRELSEGPQRRATKARRQRLAHGAIERAGVIYLSPRAVTRNEGDRPDGGS